MNTPARRVLSFEEMTQPGDFMWSETRMTFVCPCGCGSHGGVAVGGDPAKHPIWGWDKNLDKPTITPSIRFLSGCQWHGYLTDGEFRSC